MKDLAIKITNLTKYYGSSRGVEEINLEVFQGEFFGFIGPNGAGKSTTIRALMGLLFPTSGELEILGGKSASLEVKKKIGFMPSEVNYYPSMNGREFLEYSARFYPGNEKKNIDKLADYFKLDLKKKILDLSLGNKKKISIIQALLHQPELLILDEPTTGLDPLMQKRFFDLIKEENNRGVTIFLSSHTLSDVQKLCGRVGIIKEGRMVNLENVESLRKKHLKRVTLSTENFSIIQEAPEVIAPEKTEGGGHFFFAGNSNNLVALLSRMEISDLTIEEPELEEIFMHYYDETALPR